MYRLKTTACFDSAHFLAGYAGKCANIHGHHWIIEAELAQQTLRPEGEKRGMIIDFGDFKRIVRELADRFDHVLIFETGSLRETTIAALEAEQFRLMEVPFRPTAECFAEYFCKTLAAQGLPVCSVTVYETPENCARFEV